MIGRGIFRLTTSDLHRGRWTREARRFSDRLYRRCGCRLGWHLGRRVHFIYRPRGRHVYPRTYCDLRSPQGAFPSSLLGAAVAMVRWVDASMEGDLDRMHDIYQSWYRDQNDRHTSDYIDERFPDFWADLRRVTQRLGEGSRSVRIFDLAPTGVSA